jgi:uncharacterized protein YkwD
MRTQALTSRTRRFLSIAVLTLSVAGVSPGLAAADAPQPARVAKAACAGADSGRVGVRRFRTAILCLHDQERARHGMRDLRWNRDLSKAAGKHARDMVGRHFFDHVSPSRKSPMDRIAAGGYKPRTGCWSGGENLYFSRGSATPRQIFRAWMGSPGHRQNILRSRWHDFGLGVVSSSPYGERAGVTVVALFGTTSQRSCG